jgi:hypothetical protein
MGVSTDMGMEKIKTQATQNKTASGYASPASET